MDESRIPSEQLDAKQVIYAILVLFSAIVLSSFLLSFMMFRLFVETIRLKRLRMSLVREKRFPSIRRKIKRTLLGERARKGVFSSFLKKKVKNDAGKCS